MAVTIPKAASVWLLVAVLVSPYVRILDLEFRMEAVMVPVVLAALVLKRRVKSIVVPRLTWLLMVPWFWTSLVTSFGLLRGESSSVPWITAYSLFRPVLVTAVYYNIGLTHKAEQRLLRWFVYLGIPLGLLSIAQVLGNTVAVSTTVAAYTSVVRTPVLNMLKQNGAIVRGVSVFESPVYAAVYFLLAIGTGILILIKESPVALRVRVWLWISILFAAVGGVVTFSATFLLGAAVLLTWLAFRFKLPSKTYLVGITVGLLVILVPLVIVLMNRNESMETQFAYQTKRILSLSVLETRYGANRGILKGAIDALHDRPFQGWGWISKPGVFTGDSYYIGVLYSGGVIGLFLSLLPLFYVMRLRDEAALLGEVVLLWLVMLLTTGVSAPSFTLPRLQDWWWAIASASVWRHDRQGAL